MQEGCSRCATGVLPVCYRTVPSGKYSSAHRLSRGPLVAVPGGSPQRVAESSFSRCFPRFSIIFRRIGKYKISTGFVQFSLGLCTPLAKLILKRLTCQCAMIEFVHGPRIIMTPWHIYQEQLIRVYLWNQSHSTTSQR